MIEVIGAFAAGGLIGYAAKDKLSNSTDARNSKSAEMDQLYTQNERLAKRNKELERENEDLLSQIKKLRREAKDNTAGIDEAEDQLDSTRRENKALRQQIEVLSSKVKEYKTACGSLEAQLKIYKSK